MRHLLFIFFFLCCLCCIITGCGVPDGLPQLAPLKVSVTKGGVPAEGVTVSVHSQSLSSNYTCRGEIQNGTISLSTYYNNGERRFAGAPVGEILIGLHRPAGWGLEDPKKVTKGMSREEGTQYSKERDKKTAENIKYVPLALRDPLISTITLQVEAGKNNELSVELDDPKWNSIKIDPKHFKTH
ncbi:MAG: hypothetical protein LBN39_11020 [Planctomycetaceae bacterium]|jgi:hypothetical protein|nr:hypothetical protein [Planctomycetaceae bacterium]